MTYQNAFRTIRCPDCYDREDIHVFCETCFGSGRIYIGPPKVPYSRAKLWQWGLLCFVVATVILIGLASR